ncbi:unnamed protein product, partial [marine sediment metagenome]
DITDAGERAAQPKRAHEAAEAGKQRAHESGLQKSAQQSARDTALIGRGIVPPKRGPAKTKRQQFQASKKSRQKQLAQLRKRQAFEERKAQLDPSAREDTTKFAGGAPIRVQLRKGGPTHEFTRGLIERGGGNLTAAQTALRTDANRARGDFDIATGRQALERTQGRGQQTRDTTKGTAGASINNVQGFDQFQRAMADINRARRVQEQRSDQVSLPQQATPAQVPAAPATAVPTVPGAPPATTVPTPPSQPTDVGATFGQQPVLQ